MEIYKFIICLVFLGQIFTLSFYSPYRFLVFLRDLANVCSENHFPQFHQMLPKAIKISQRALLIKAIAGSFFLLIFFYYGFMQESIARLFSAISAVFFVQIIIAMTLNIRYRHYSLAQYKNMLTPSTRMANLQSRKLLDYVSLPIVLAWCLIALFNTGLWIYVALTVSYSYFSTIIICIVLFGGLLSVFSVINKARRYLENPRATLHLKYTDVEPRLHRHLKALYFLSSAFYIVFILIGLLFIDAIPSKAAYLISLLPSITLQLAILWQSKGFSGELDLYKDQTNPLPT